MTFHWDFALIFAALGILIPWRGSVRVSKLIARPQISAEDRLSIYASTIAFQWVLTGVIAWRCYARVLTPENLGLTSHSPGLTAIVTAGMAIELVARRMGRRLQRFDDLLGEHGFMVVLLIRLCPVGNNFLTNYLAGVTAIPLGTFLTASFVGYLPESLIFALLGSGFTDHPHLRLWGGIGLLVAFSLFFLWYFRRSKEGAKILAAMRRE